MKKTITTLLLLSCITAFSFAQSIVMTSGTIDFIKDQQVIQFTFSYDEMLVGKLTENEYVDKKSSEYNACLLYTSPSPRDRTRSRMPSSA